MALDFLAPVVERRREIIVSQLKNAYKSGKCSEKELFGYSASLCSLDDLMADIKSAIRKGEKIAEKVNAAK